MNRDDVIRWAREVGLHLPYWADDEDPEIDPPRWTMVSPLPLLLERFAALVAAAAKAEEREAAEERVADLFADMETPYLPDIVFAIRARKENT